MIGKVIRRRNKKRRHERIYVWRGDKGRKHGEKKQGEEARKGDMEMRNERRGNNEKH